MPKAKTKKITKKVKSRKKVNNLEHMFEPIKSLITKLLIPTIFKGISDYIHTEIDQLLSKIENKIKGLISHFLEQLIQVFLLLISFIFILLGVIYFFIDIIGISRSYLLLCVGIILLFILIILRSAYSRKTQKIEN